MWVPSIARRLGESLCKDELLEAVGILQRLVIGFPRQVYNGFVNARWKERTEGRVDPLARPSAIIAGNYLQREASASTAV